MSEQQKTCTYIGGQAVLEGVMMRGKRSTAIAVRDPQGNIQVESERITPPEKRKKITKAPFIRGVINFVLSLKDGYKALMRSADVAMEDDEEQTKAEKWLKEKHHVDLGSIFNFIAGVLGVALALVLFIALPQWITGYLPFEKTSIGLDGLWFNLIEGGIRLGVFIGYILLISLIPSLRRVFQYHGAEHKTITCFELGKPLTTENVKGCSRVHDRCGTTFLFLVMVVSILVFSLVNVVVARWLYVGNGWDGFIRFGLKIAMLPVVAGVSYEILRLLAKTQNPIFLLVKWPGLLLQRLTTREPDEQMIECAVTAFETVLKMDEDESVPEKVFATPGKMSWLLSNTKHRFAPFHIEEDEAEWIFALTLNIPKSSVATEERILKIAEAKKIIAIADERLTGRPLWYIIGDADFCGYKIKVDERVLIPRPETEDLAMMAIAAAEENCAVLDLCTGSGALAIAIYKELEKKNYNPKVTAVDISADALALAKENAEENGADIRFIQSDLFTRLRGRFDVIVSNPPYIPTAEIPTLQPEVKGFEPHLALDGGEDGLDFYRRIAAEAGKYLNRGGVLIMEVGAGQASSVAKLFKGNAYTMISQDFNGVDRYVKVVM